MRTIWKGSIAFGLVNVPVKLYSATEDHDIALHQVHDKDGGRIRYQRRCEVCGRVVKFDDIDKAYEGGGETVILTDEDVQSLPEERSREIEVVEFVPSDQVDPITLDRSYFLEPDGSSTKAYTLLRRTLEETERTAIVHFSLRQKSRLGALRVRDDVLMLQSLLWDDEVRDANFAALDKSPRVTAKELELSASLVESLSTDFSAEKFTDDYQEQLQKLIDEKLKHGDAVNTAATFGDADAEGGGEVIDLMEALRRSVGDKGSKAKPRSNSKSDAKKSGPSRKKPAASHKKKAAS